MPDSVFTYRMPAGIPGDVSRFSVYGTTVKAENQNLTTPVTTYGQVCTIDTNGARPLAAGDTAAPAIIGFSVRPFPVLIIPWPCRRRIRALYRLVLALRQLRASLI
jgi:hypothetical protein